LDSQWDHCAEHEALAAKRQDTAFAKDKGDLSTAGVMPDPCVAAGEAVRSA
jgi:hypothetical protein